MLMYQSHFLLNYPQIGECLICNYSGGELEMDTYVYASATNFFLNVIEYNFCAYL
jgi:hypothetical protein